VFNVVCIIMRSPQSSCLPVSLSSQSVLFCLVPSHLVSLVPCLCTRWIWNPARAPHRRRRTRRKVLRATASNRASARWKKWHRSQAKRSPCLPAPAKPHHLQGLSNPRLRKPNPPPAAPTAPHQTWPHSETPSQRAVNRTAMSDLTPNWSSMWRIIQARSPGSSRPHLQCPPSPGDQPPTNPGAYQVTKQGRHPWTRTAPGVDRPCPQAIRHCRVPPQSHATAPPSPGKTKLPAAQTAPEPPNHPVPAPNHPVKG